MFMISWQCQGLAFNQISWGEITYLCKRSLLITLKACVICKAYVYEMLLKITQWKENTSHRFNMYYPAHFCHSAVGKSSVGDVTDVSGVDRSGYSRVPVGEHKGHHNNGWYAKSVAPLHWRHNGRDSVSNHPPHHCLLNRLFRRRSKKTSKLRVTGLCVEIHRGPVNSPHKWPVTRKMFPFDDVIMQRPHLTQTKSFNG